MPIENFLNNKKPESIPIAIKTELTKSEFTSYAGSIWRIKNPPRNDKQNEHGSTFPKELIIPLIQLYCRKPYEYVLDPFMGTGSTLSACKELFRHCIGFELNPTYYKWCSQIKNQHPLSYFVPSIESKKPIDIKLYNEDCRNVLNHVQPNSVQLMVTSPPYANFIERSLQDRQKRTDNKMPTSNITPYSTDKRDFCTLNYPDYLEEIKLLMEKLYTVTKSKGYNIWIVKDYRLTEENIPYVPFHSDIAAMGTMSGFLLHDIIIWDQGYNRKNMFRGSMDIFYTNQNLSFMVILRKP